MRLVACIALLAAAASTAHGEPIKLRMATIAPEGTAWARELAAFSRDVEAATHGAVRVKIYYSSIAGDELTVLERIRRDQLDGAIGSESCMLLGPSMKVTRIVGLFQSRDESAYVITRLKPLLDKEFLRNGFVNLGHANLGPEVLFTREPVRDLKDLRRIKLWVWDLDESLRIQAVALGLNVVPRPIDRAAHAYDERAVDGFIAVPTGALAFQWSAQAGYLEDLHLSYRNGCVFFSSRAFDALPIDAQQYLKTTGAAKLRARIEDLGRQQDDALLGGLLARQGLKTVPVSEQFRAEFFDAARNVRARPGNQIVDEKLLAQVLSWLADYRAVHQPTR